MPASPSSRRRQCLSNGVQSRCWTSYTALVPFLAFAAHNLPGARAFSPGSHRHLGNVPGLGVGRRSLQQLQDRGLGFAGQQIHKNSRISSSSKFFVASTTGRPLNGDNDKNSYFASSEEEIPWECIVDPNCCDECTDLVEQMHPNLDGAAWTKTEDEDRVTLRDKASMGATFLTGVLAFAFLLMKSGPGSWRFFLAGGLCAAASHAIPTPIDVVKVGTVLLAGVISWRAPLASKNTFVVWNGRQGNK